MTSQANLNTASLLDLGQQFAFEIDDDLVKEICFAETLIISCAHHEGDVEDSAADGEETTYGGGETSSSEWVCSSTTSQEEEVKEEVAMEIKDYVAEEEVHEEQEEHDDFHFYFFPDCDKKPSPVTSKQTIILGPDGMPLVNPAAIDAKYCLCKKNKRDATCKCNVILPCKCGAKEKKECTCKDLKEICICHDLPAVKCTCKKEKTVCTCFPGAPNPVCKCHEIQKPCICDKSKFPFPVCQCKHKPRPHEDTHIPLGLLEVVEEDGEGEGESETVGEGERHDEGQGEVEGGAEHVGEGEFETEEYAKKSLSRMAQEPVHDEPLEPCECQKPDPPQRCYCRKGGICICLEDSCVCGAQKSCVCEASESYDAPCQSQSSDSKIVCECPIPKNCTCDPKGSTCKCFLEKPVCTCGDPENCKCQHVCDCVEPCICDTLAAKKEEDEEICICLDPCKQLKAGQVCTCPVKDAEARKIKKVRKGKHGWRWCNEVDPYHTFFDYAYDRHHLIDYREQEKEKLKILGLYAEKEEICPVHAVKYPRFEKKVRKPSLDCCSAVGGISISVEPLGDEGDKFLVNVISHASKEGSKTGSKLVSIVDRNLHTLEENRTESITKKGLTKQRKSYVAICDIGYYNKVTRTCGDRNVVRRLYHNFEDAKTFLLEGSNVVLMRYFGLRRFKGHCKTTTVLIDGTICESIYVCPGVSQAVVNGKPLCVVKVERHIIEPNGFFHQTLTVLTLRGYIISHEWHDNSYMLHVNPLLQVNSEKDTIEEHAPLSTRWREDLQLFSDYLDHKATRSGEGARYISENGKLTSAVRDYLQAILLLKPTEVLHFTQHYFESALSSMDLPRDEYFDPNSKHVRYFFIED